MVGRGVPGGWERYRGVAWGVPRSVNIKATFLVACRIVTITMGKMSIQHALSNDAPRVD